MIYNEAQYDLRLLGYAMMFENLEQGSGLVELLNELKAHGCSSKIIVESLDAWIKAMGNK